MRESNAGCSSSPRTPPSTLHMANLSECIGNGLEEKINGFLRAYPKTVLVVIDTLQKVRGTTVDSNACANDYGDISVLKQLADEQHVVILLIHHLRKTADDDPLNMISGTTGISDATDSSFVLKGKRGSQTATLYCTGRDIEYRELPLRFSKETRTWELTKSIEEEQATVIHSLSPSLDSSKPSPPSTEQPRISASCGNSRGENR